MEYTKKLEKIFSRYLVKERSIFSRYSVSFLLLLGSLITIYFLNLHEVAPMYSLALVAIIASAVHGGLGPALINSFIGAFVVNFALIGSESIRNDLSLLLNSGFWFRFVLYLVTSLLVAFLIVEVRRLFKTSEQSKEVAEAANKLKDNLIRVIAHDLKNPLGIIVGYSDLLNLKTFPQDRVREIAQKISATSMELNCLVEDLLVAPKSGKQFVSKELKPVRIDKLLATVVESQSVYSARKGIEIDFRVPDKSEISVAVKADARKLARVFQNIIDNAIKYSPVNSRISIEMIPMNQKVHIRFVDKGPGIHPDDIQKLFRPWGKTRNATTSNEASSGLGLSICKELIEGMGGSIEFTNMHPCGSKFTLVLPVHYEVSAPVIPIQRAVNA